MVCAVLACKTMTVMLTALLEEKYYSNTNLEPNARLFLDYAYLTSVIAQDSGSTRLHAARAVLLVGVAPSTGT